MWQLRRGMVAGRGALDAAAGGGGGGLVLDGITTGIKYAFSTRKLRTAYSGPALKIQRTDATTLDIGFVANECDNAAINAFIVGGDTGKVVTWYDQSGNGNDHVAPNFAAGLRICIGATLIENINGKTAMKNTTGASVEYLQNTSLTANPVNTLYVNAVVKGSNGSGGDYAIVGPSVPAGFEWRFDGDTAPLRVLKSQSASLFASTSNTTLVGMIAEVQYNPVSGAWAMWINRVAAGSGTVTATFTAATSDISSRLEQFRGTIGELIAYDLVGGIPGASQTIIRDNQATYWGTP